MHKTFLTEDTQYTFLKARATNTRLMGVVGLEVNWTSADGHHCLQIFHLDFEAYGIDGYHQFFDGDAEEIERVRRGVTGGLGGNFLDITFESAIALIDAARSVDPLSTALLVDFEWFEYYLNLVVPSISETMLEVVTHQLMPNALSDIACINYFLMRLVGCDSYGAEMLYSGDAREMLSLVHTPSTLLKNTIRAVIKAATPHRTGIESTARRYEASALIDFEDKYRLMIIEVVVAGDAAGDGDSTNASDEGGAGIETKSTTGKSVPVGILSASLKETLTVSSIEASFNLNKPEYMMVLQAKDSFIERRFERLNPEFMKQTYRGGNLYLEYNPHNRHVGENPYYLNGDLYAAYFFAFSGQVVIASFEQAHIAEIDRLFSENGIYEESLSFICELRTDFAVTYSFAQSAFDNIFDFLDHHAF